MNSQERIELGKNGLMEPWVAETLSGERVGERVSRREQNALFEEPTRTQKQAVVRPSAPALPMLDVVCSLDGYL